MKQLIEGSPLTVVGDGSQSRDFVYVTDVANAFILASISEFDGEVFNIGGGNPRSINEIVSILNKNVLSLPQRPGEPKITWADITKANKMLGWYPVIGLEEGISKMLAEIEYWNDAPLWSREKISVATKNWFKYLGDSYEND
jgi:UDP-glucose 4-epimerase